MWFASIKGGGAKENFLLEIINILILSLVASITINIALLIVFLINLSKKQ